MKIGLILFQLRNLQSLSIPNEESLRDRIPKPTCDQQTEHECYEKQKAQIAEDMRKKFDLEEEKVKEEMSGRRLDSTPINYYYPIEYYGSAEDFIPPCYALSGDDALDIANGWVKLPIQDDLATEVVLDFPFELFDLTFPAGTRAYINTNGVLSFEGPEFFHGPLTGAFDPQPFPVREYMIAPFWADVDTRPQEAGDQPHGYMWYRLSPTENTLSVIWDRVGYYLQQGNRRNTFQLVISDRSVATMGQNTNSGNNNNVCFCYGDMEWTTGTASLGIDGFGGSFGTPAIVGANRGRESADPNAPNGPSQTFGQFAIGNSDVWDGAGPDRDGIDFLDHLGTNFQGVDYEPLCFDAADNIPPVCIGFPSSAVNVDCNEELQICIGCTTPEQDEVLTVGIGGSIPPGAVISKTSGPTHQNYCVTYKAQIGHAGTYEIQFFVLDGAGGETRKTITLIVPECGNDKCVPNGSPDPTCEHPVNPDPFCTPFRSPEYCPADESFPDLIRTRNDIANQDSQMIENQNFWFHYFNDKAAQYAFTTSQGYNAPRVYCCVDDINDLMSTCFGGANPPTSFVVRASGHHSGSGIFVLPNGFGGVELLSGMTKSFATISAEILALTPTPDKILVEEFIAGQDGPNTLPNEFKFHMFGDKIGAITAIYNRGTPCGCYAEFDEQFERLDQYGCFEPGFPAQPDGACYFVDCDEGRNNIGQIKGFDICRGPLPPIPTCIWDDMMTAARALGNTIGVYMRIDMFVSAEGLVYIQEYTSNHNGGLRHCTARQDPSGCIDSCFMGECWKENGEKPNGSLVFGGPRTAEPVILADWSTRTSMVQCNIATGQSPPSPPISSCFTPDP